LITISYYSFSVS